MDMDMFWRLFIIAVFAIVGVKVYRRVRRQRRQQWLESCRFPESLKRKVMLTYPHLSLQDAELVSEGLRAYFQVCNLAGPRMVAMPSQVVDVAWHEFILSTRKYQAFCQQALGRFLHHTPSEAMAAPTQAQEGIKRAWKLACYLEKINPQKPNRLPLLFAMDGLLDIENGFHYSLNCAESAKGEYCASHIGCGSCSSCAGDASGCGGGCGGD